MDRIGAVSKYINSYLRELKNRMGFVFEDVSFDEMLHTYGVAYFSASIAYKRGLNPEIAYIIGLLHDAGRIVENVLNGDHGRVSSELSREMLAGSGMFKKEEIETICSALENHSNKGEIGENYDEVIKDADVLERIFCMGDKCENSKAKRRRLENSLKQFELGFRE